MGFTRWSRVTGGTVENPTYRAVCEGTTGHAEVTQIRFDPAIISFETLLDWLWRHMIPPRSIDRVTMGTQYARNLLSFRGPENRC